MLYSLTGLLLFIRSLDVMCCRKVRGEIDRERKTQDMLLRDLRQQLQQQNEEIQSQANGKAVGVRASQSMRSSKNK
jgi:hypothetical protein